MPSSRQPSQQGRAAVFGARVRLLRRSLKLTQREVAERIPMSGANLSRIENGDQGPPADEVIVRLAEVLRADRDELLRLAGRSAERSDFESRVLAELRGMREELRTCFKSLQAALERRE
jgi:transcriptional regulator with XRE-family HTH domain